MIGSKLVALALIAGMAGALPTSTKLDPRATGEAYVEAVDENGNTVAVFRRDEGPSVADILNSCPGSNIKSGIQRADGCEFQVDGDQSGVKAPYKKTHQLSKPVENCSNGQPIQQTLGGSTTFTREWSVTVSESVDFPGISASWSFGTSHSNSQAVDRSDTITINNGQKGAIGADQYYKQTKGSVFAHYGDRVDRHYYWYARNVFVDAPDGDAVPSAQVIPCSSEFKWDP